jgi:hypothetical protein
MWRHSFLKVIFFTLTFICLSSAEPALGGISLGESYNSIVNKYPFPAKFMNLERGQLPYPLNLEVYSTVYIAQAPKRNIECYLNAEQEVIAISVFIADEKDKTLYETDKGLRLMDSLVELKMTYGTPVHISEYAYKDLAFKGTVTRRVYYYPDLCVQTRQYGEAAEVIDTLLVGKYIPELVAQKKDIRISPKKL